MSCNASSTDKDVFFAYNSEILLSYSRKSLASTSNVSAFKKLSLLERIIALWTNGAELLFTIRLLPAKSKITPLDAHCSLVIVVITALFFTL